MENNKTKEELLEEIKHLEAIISESKQKSNSEKILGENLSSQNNILSLVFNNTSDLQIIVGLRNEDTFIIDAVNKAYLDTAATFGLFFTESDIVGKSLQDILFLFGIDDTIYKTTIERYKKVASTYEVIKYTEIIEVGNGTYFSEITLSPILDKNGKCTHILYSSRNTTEENLAKKALEESEARLRLSLEVSQASVFEDDFEKGTMISTPELYRSLGYQDHEIPTQLEKVFEMMHPDDVQKTTQDLQDHFTGKTKDYYTEFRFKAKSGEWRWVDGKGRVIKWNAKGEPTVLLGITQDITERKQNKIELELSENRFRTLATFAPVGVYITNEFAQCEYANPNWLRMAGITLEQALGDGWQTAIHPEDKDIVLKDWNKVVKSKGTFGKEYRFQSPSGKITWIYGTATALNDKNGKLIGYIGANTDITSQKLANEEIHLAHARLQAFIDSPQDLIMWSLDTDGKYVAFNKNHRAEMLKVYNANIEVGDYMLDLIGNPEIKSAFQKNINNVLIGKSFNDIIKGPETNRYFHLFWSPVIKENGEIVGVSCVVLNISKQKQDEEEIRKFRTISDKALHGNVIADLQGKLIYVNDYFAGIHGLKAKDIIGENLSIFHSEDQFEEVLKINKALEKEGNYSNLEVWHAHQNGDKFPMLMSGVTIPDEKGNPQYVAASAIDIRERNLAENALRSIATQFSAISGQEFFDEVCKHLTSSLKIDYAIIGEIIENKERIRVKAGYALGKPMRSMEYDLSHAPCENNASGSLCFYPSKVKELFPKYSLLVEMNIDAYLGIPLYKRDGTPLGTLAIMHSKAIRNIETAKSLLKIFSNRIAAEMERYQIDIAKTESDRKLNTLFNNLKGIAYRCRNDNDWTMEVFSEGFEEITGYKIEDFIENKKHAYNDIILPEDRDRVWQEVQLALEMKQSFELNYQIITASGERRYMLEKGIGIFDEKTGEVIALEGLITDVTKQVLVEEKIVDALSKAEESDRLKSAFLANMSHEIRTPMNGILGFADLLKQPGLDGDEQQTYVKIIEKGGKRLLNIINDLIDISKIESGQMGIVNNNVNINEQIEYLFTFFRPEAESKGLVLSYKNALPSNKAIIKCDKEKFIAILTNLIKNAIKYTQQGSIELGYSRKDKFIEFFVKDTGMGIPKNRHKAVFDRFVQADSSLASEFEGAGLGLSITKGYVEMLGGEIWLKSRKVAGSIFYFTLPYNTEETTLDIPMSNSISEEKLESLKKLTILVAEDDAMANSYLAIILKDISKVIFYAKNGKEAVELCKQNPDIDLILMDVKMPLMDGYEATQIIRTFNKEVLIVAQTAYALAGDANNAIANGCNDYLAKPISKKDVYTLLNKYILNK